MKKFLKEDKIFIIIAVLIGLAIGGITGYLLAPKSITKIKQPDYPATAQFYKVTKVIDGDTIEVKINRKIKLVRFLGINTPEVENEYRHQECFGPEASKETKKLLTGKKVYLLPDPQSPDTGKYGRLLRYVFLPNGEFVNADLIRQGYAFKYIYQPIQFMDYFSFLENQAKKQRLGLWGSKCNYYYEEK